jgi:hypothetical protein
MRWFFTCLILSGGIAFAQSQQLPTESNPPSAQAIQPTAPDKRGTDEMPLSIKVLPSEDAQIKGKQEEQERNEKAEIDKKLAFETQRIADYTFWLGAFTLALFCAAVGQIALFWIQLNYMRQTVRDAALAQRAYVTVELEGIHPFITEGAPAQPIALGHVVFKNGGHLPAKNFRWFVNIETDADALRKIFPIPETEDGFEGTTVLAPGSTMKFGTSKITLPPDGWVYVWGAVIYDAIAPGRMTKFCHRYNLFVISRMENGWGIPRDYGRIHRYGNDAS